MLIGGNGEAERKAGELIRIHAGLTVIAPRITPAMQQWHERGLLDWIDREYREGDLQGAFMVIVAEFEGDINTRIWEEAKQAGILCNVMDDIPHCNFTFGALVKRGPLNLAISTSGAAPSLAVRLRERFEKEFGPEYENFLDFMQSLRAGMKQHYPDFDQRKALWYKLIDSDVLDLFREGKPEEAWRRTAEITELEAATPHPTHRK